MNERPTSHHSEACIHCTKERKRLSLLPTSASHRSSNWWNRSKRNELKAAYRRAFFPIDFFKSIKSCLVFFSIPLLHCKYSFCFYAAVEEGRWRWIWQTPRPSERRVAWTSPYVAVSAWRKLSLSLSWLASCMRASLALSFGCLSWAALFLLTPLFWMRKDMVWWISTWWYGYGSEDLWGWKRGEEEICMYGYWDEIVAVVGWLNMSLNWTNNQTMSERMDRDKESRHEWG